MFTLFCIGTGKTATVLSSISALKNENRKSLTGGPTLDFDFIEINCLRLQSPADACKYQN